MFEVIEGERHDATPPASRTRHGRSAVAAVVVAAVVALVVVAGLAWWNEGGTHLVVAGGGFGMTAPVGDDLSIGLQATKDDGGPVVLDSVSATVSSGAQVTWSVYQAAPGAQGLGSVAGPLTPRWPTVALDGYHRVATSDIAREGSTWIVGTLHTDAPGVYRLLNITIRYHSGRRHRTTTASGTSLCALSFPASFDWESFQRTNDPLLAMFDQCQRP